MANFNENAERALEQTMAQTRGAMEQYFNFIQGAFSAGPFGGTELSEKMKSFTEANIASAQTFVQKLGQAKDFQQAMQIQSEFLRSQFTNAGEHMRQITGEVMSAARDAAKPKS